MSKQKEKLKAIYEPGELDKTRKNLGEISPEEAMEIAQKLGGEIGVEKSQDFSKALYKSTKRYIKRGDESAKPKDKPLDSAQVKEKKETILHTQFKTQKNNSTNILPAMRSQSRKLLDTIMMSSEYRIKPNYGIFTFIIQAIQGNNEKVSPQFVLHNLQQYFLNMQKFHVSVKNMINYTTDGFNKLLSQEQSNYYKSILFITGWNIEELQEQYKQLEAKAKNISIVKLIPFTKVLFRLILPIYYLGEENIISFLKQVYTDNAPYLKKSKETLMSHIKEAASRWIYIYGQIAKGMYPILLRMTCNDFVDYPAFYIKRNANILQFLNLSKFDILLPESTKKTSSEIKIDEDEKNVEKEEKQTEKEKKEQEQNAEAAIDSMLLERGIDILDNLFPDAGWKKISSKPDLYPYFQPIYNFEDGFNLIAPSNPMQVTIVLHRILEDFFQGLRNIKYSIDKEPEFTIYKDNINTVFSQWSSYREYQFEKVYLVDLKEYVNQAYTQSEFIKTTYAKKLLSNFFWQTKYHFLPHMPFELIFMEKPSKDSQLSPLPSRVSFLKQMYKILVNRVDQNKLYAKDDKTKNTDIYGAQGLFHPYHFDIPNPISKRIDILLNKKKSLNANNLNLIKYTLCILTVLDWWINNKESPANNVAASLPYRTSSEDGNPIFYVTERTDIDRVFIQNVKTKLSNKENNNNNNEAANAANGTEKSEEKEV